MLEIALLVAICVLMGKIAAASNCHPGFWGGITAVLTIASVFLLPWPFLRLMIAGAIAIVAMTVYRMKAGII